MSALRSAALNHAHRYPTPKSVNFHWTYGAQLLMFLILQVITGIFLAFFYRAGDGAFGNIIYIVNDVNYGYIFKYMHLNGASVVFFFLYLHMYRAIRYGAYLHLPMV
jgi:quinol-cytochrome oxidoreductase complex cytochrome b subunit